MKHHISLQKFLDKYKYVDLKKNMSKILKKVKKTKSKQ